MKPIAGDTFEGCEYVGLQEGKFLLLTDPAQGSSHLFLLEISIPGDERPPPQQMALYRQTTANLLTVARELSVLRRCRRDLIVEIGDIGTDRLADMYVAADPGLFKQLLEVVAGIPLRAIEGREAAAFAQLIKLMGPLRRHPSLAGSVGGMADGLRRHRQDWDRLVQLIRSLRDFATQSEPAVREWRAKYTSSQLAEFIQLLECGDGHLEWALSSTQEALGLLHTQISLRSRRLLTIPYRCESFRYIEGEFETLVFITQAQGEIGWYTIDTGHLVMHQMSDRPRTTGKGRLLHCYRGQEVWVLDQQRGTLLVHSSPDPEPRTITNCTIHQPERIIGLSPRAALGLSSPESGAQVTIAYIEVGED